MAETVTFVPGTGVLQRAVRTDADQAAFRASETCRDILRFLEALAQAARGVPAGSKTVDGVSPPALRLVEVLARARALVAAVPPIEQPMRFGNRAFRTWHARLAHEALRWVNFIVDGEEEPAAAAAKSAPTLSLDGEAAEAAAAPAASPAAGVQREELREYLVDCFGNATRLDYGTGHEACFLLFLLALRRAGALAASDMAFLATSGWGAYMETVRAVQRAYMLEPAGSHGVWSLDDYQVLVFLLGAAQLVGLEGSIRPVDAQDPDRRAALASEWNFFSAVEFVHHVKSGAPFQEHSPLLFELTEMPTWDRILRKLLATFLTEVLGKLPVTQHMLFGSLIPVTWARDHSADSRRQEGIAQGARYVVPRVGADGAGAGGGGGGGGGGAHVDVVTKAPWATAGRSAAPVPQEDVVTKAPWATAGRSAAPVPHDEVATKAPWATASHSAPPHDDVATKAPWAATSAPKPHLHPAVHAEPESATSSSAGHERLHLPSNTMAVSAPWAEEMCPGNSVGAGVAAGLLTTAPWAIPPPTHASPETHSRRPRLPTPAEPLAPAEPARHDDTHMQAVPEDPEDAE